MVVDDIVESIFGGVLIGFTTIYPVGMYKRIEFFLNVFGSINVFLNIHT